MHAEVVQWHWCQTLKDEINMATRHRIPSIFNLSMVDVLCCALGCVLLLWLLNLREARDRTAEASETGQQLSAARQQLAAVGKDLNAVRGELADLMHWTAGLSVDLDQARRDAAANRQRFLSAEEQGRATALMLEKTQGERDAARSSIADLEKKLVTAGRRAEDLTGRMSDAEGRIKQLQALADQLPGLRDELKSYRDKFSTEHALAQALEKNIKQRTQELGTLGKEREELRMAKREADMSLAAWDKELAQLLRSLQAAEGEKKDLLAEVDRTKTERKSLLTEIERAKAAAENRFAGINLTGRRV